MFNAVYSHRQISTVENLAKHLEVDLNELIFLKENSSKFIYPNTPEIKPNGSVRQTYRVNPRLGKVQKRVVTKIFHFVQYPSYLQGSIKDKKNPRDPISDASLHSNKKILISEDISNFFPSICYENVLKMWKYLFCFHPSVAEVLSCLTTLKGKLYQGACTSPYLANLIFWDSEPYIVKEFYDQGYTYSRYVDDVTVSSSRYISKSEKTEIIRKIYGLFASRQLSPNRKKHRIETSKNKMVVHNLIVNSEAPSLERKERERIRAAIKECELAFKECSGKGEKYKSLYLSCLGRVNRMMRMHSRKGQKMLDALHQIKPN